MQVYVYDVYVKKLEILMKKKDVLEFHLTHAQNARAYSISKVPFKHIHVYVIIFHQDTCVIVSVQKKCIRLLLCNSYSNIYQALKSYSMKRRDLIP